VDLPIWRCGVTGFGVSPAKWSFFDALKGLAVCFIASLPLPAMSQSTEEASISVGEASLIPAVRMDFITTDNVFGTKLDEVSANGFVLSPSVKWVANRGLLAINANYAGSYGRFSESAVDYNDHELSFTAGAEISSRHRVSSILTINKEHEPLGTGQTRGLSQSLDEQIETTSITANLNYSFGAVNARGNFRTNVSYGDVNYSNLENLTAGATILGFSSKSGSTPELSSSS
jgi:hypothetical protein